MVVLLKLQVSMRIWNPISEKKDHGRLFNQFFHPSFMQTYLGKRGNPSPTLEKSATDFGEIRHWIAGNLSLILGRCVTGFVKLRFWEKNVPFLGWTGSVRFWDKWLRFGENRRSLGEKKLVRFLDWLGQSSSFTVLNAKHVWVCNF